MTECYVGEIRLLPYTRTPTEWQLCDGSLLPISQYEVLYTVIGTTYGGDGQTTFAVPDLRGAVPIHEGQGPGLNRYVLGQRGGSETVTLTQQQMPSHFHVAVASTSAGGSTSPTNNYPATVSNEACYTDMNQGGTAYPLPPNTLGMSGSNLPHENCAPTLTINYFIATYGIFPSQN